MQAAPPGPSVEEIWSQRHNDILKDYYANKEAARRNKFLQRGGVLQEPRVPIDLSEASKENEDNESSRNNSQLSERSINSGNLFRQIIFELELFQNLHQHRIVLEQNVPHCSD